MGKQSVDAVSDVKRPKGRVGIRHLQAIMLFLAMLILYAIRVNISMAIVVMTDKANDNAFDWSMQTQSVILSSFFWGYVVLQIPGGEMAAKYGGMVLILFCIGLNSAISMVTPISAYYGGWRAVCACRVLQGLSQGVLYPSLHNLIGKWVPLEEKSRLGTFIYAGGQLGTALQLVVSGFIAEFWGWPAIFYLNGSLGAIWVVAYIFLGSDSPQNSKMISDEERLYIQTSLGHVGTQKKHKTPWKSIMTSVPFISLIVVHCCQSWGFWTLMTEIPSYFKQVLDVNIKSNGMLSALPYLAMFSLSFPFGYVCDRLIEKKILTVTATRKISNSIGHFGPALALVGLSYSPAGNVTIALLILTVVVGLNAGHLTGFMLVHIDMAPNFAGTMMGITNCFSNIMSIIAPLTAGALLHDETSASDWRKVFYLSTALYILGNSFYVICGTSEKQQWNDQSESDKKNDEAAKISKVSV